MAFPGNTMPRGHKELLAHPHKPPGFDRAVPVWVITRTAGIGRRRIVAAIMPQADYMQCFGLKLKRGYFEPKRRKHKVVSWGYFRFWCPEIMVSATLPTTAREDCFRSNSEAVTELTLRALAGESEDQWVPAPAQLVWSAPATARHSWIVMKNP